MTLERLQKYYFREGATVIEITDAKAAKNKMKKSKRSWDSGTAVWGSAGEWILLDGKIKSEKKSIWWVAKRETVVPFTNQLGQTFW